MPQYIHRKENNKNANAKSTINKRQTYGNKGTVQ